MGKYRLNNWQIACLYISWHLISTFLSIYILYIYYVKCLQYSSVQSFNVSSCPRCVSQVEFQVIISCIIRSDFDG